MSDHSDNDIPTNGSPRPLRRDADKGREPHLLPGQLGQRWISLNALVERIESAFIEEHDADLPELREADTPAKRLKLVLATTDYILAVESAQVSLTEKADIINRVYSNLFGYGPLDLLFLDERVTTISYRGCGSIGGSLCAWRINLVRSHLPKRRASSSCSQSSFDRCGCGKP